MASSTRHRSIGSLGPLSTPDEALRAWSDGYYGHPAGIRWPRVSRLVHFLLRVSPPPSSPERGKPGPVADLRLCPPVGEPVDAPPLMALLREGRVPNKPGRP